MDKIGREPLILTRAVYRALERACLAAAPREACGLLGGRGRVASSHYQVPNVARQPRKQFFMDPRRQAEALSLIDRRNEQLVAIYHSHPRTGPVPSQLDIEQAAYPEVFYLIASIADGGSGIVLKAYRIDPAVGRAMSVHWSIVTL